MTPRRAAPEADATRDLYERYARQIYTYCLHQLGNREEAEDAVQSTFLNAFRGYQRGVDPAFESAWIYKIAQNVCLTRQRSSSRRRKVETASDLDAMQDYVPAHEIDADELIHLPEALDAMPHQQRKALLLREWQGLSYKEIAEELGLSQAAVETLLFRARRSLAAGLNEEPAKKSALQRLRSGGDAGSALALLKSLLLTGGAKVATAVATVAATSVVAATPATRHAVEDVITPGHDRAPAPAHQVARSPGSGGAPASSRVVVPPRLVSATPSITAAPARKHVPPTHAAATLHPRASRVLAPAAPAVHPPAAVEPVAVTPAAPAPAPSPVAPAAVDTPAPSAPAPAPAAAQPAQAEKPKGEDKKTEATPQSSGAPPATPAQPAPPAKSDDARTTKNDVASGAPGNGGSERTTSSGGTATTAAAPPPAPDQSPRNKDNGNGNGNGKNKPVDLVPMAVTAPAAPPVATTTTTAAAPPPPPTATVTTTTAPPPAVTTPPAAPSDNGNGRGNNGNGTGHRR